MKATIAIAAAALALGGCASDPYVSYGGAYHDGYGPYAYDGAYYAPRAYSYEPFYYSYGPAYAYPSAGATFYYRDDDRDHSRNRWRDRGRDDDGRDHWRGRGREDRGDRGRESGRNERPHEPLDTRHGEAGNEAGMR